MLALDNMTKEEVTADLRENGGAYTESELVDSVNEATTVEQTRMIAEEIIHHLFLRNSSN